MPIGVAGAIIGAGALGAGASLYASKQQSDAANRAADIQQQGLAQQQAMYAQSRAGLQPYMDVGTNAAYSLADIYGLARPGSAGGQEVIDRTMKNFTNTPDYQFTYDQGLRALDRTSAAKGLRLSGAQLRGAQQFGQGLASQQFGNYYNRLLSLAQMGGQAAGTAMSGSNQAASNMGNMYGNIGNSYLAQGQAQASGIVGAANNLNSSLNNYLMYNKLDRGNPSSYAGLQMYGGTNSPGGWW